MDVFIPVIGQFFLFVSNIKGVDELLFFFHPCSPTTFSLQKFLLFKNALIYLYVSFLPWVLVILTSFSQDALPLVLAATGNWRESSCSRLAQWEGEGFNSHPRPSCMFSTGLVRHLWTDMLTWVNWLIGNGALSAGVGVEIYLGCCLQPQSWLSLHSDHEGCRPATVVDFRLWLRNSGEPTATGEAMSQRLALPAEDHWVNLSVLCCFLFRVIHHTGNHCQTNNTNGKKIRESNFFVCFEAHAAVKRFDPGVYLFTYFSDLQCELTHVNT